jgi:hypothetical protein
VSFPNFRTAFFQENEEQIRKEGQLQEKMLQAALSKKPSPIAIGWLICKRGLFGNWKINQLMGKTRYVSGI